MFYGIILENFLNKKLIFILLIQHLSISNININASDQPSINFEEDSVYMASMADIISPSKDLKINEILANNANVNSDENGEYDDWVELYNFGDDTINLNGLYVSDNFKNLAKYQITEDINIAPLNYILIWADEEPEQGPLHLNFKLDGEGERLYISNEALEVLDSVNYPLQTTNISYGRLNNNFLNWNYFSLPTPGTVNQDTGLLQILTAPCSNYQSGFYSGPVDIELISPYNFDIYYTLNGSAPDENSNHYDTAITISSTTVLRYRCIKPGYVPSTVQTQTFFFNAEYDLDIVSLAAPGNSILGSDGIFKSTNTNIEKPVHIEYFGNDKNLKFKLDGGLHLHSPKTNPQYSLRIYARSDYGEDEINYKIFDDKNIYSFKRLVLRNAGNDALQGSLSNRAHFRDAFHHILLNKTGNSQAMCSYKPVNVFINGKYYGIYNLREHIDKYFIEPNYGYNGKMDLLERAFDYPGNRYAIEGSFKTYDSLCNYMRAYDMSNDEMFEFVENNIDIDKIIDYWIHEVYIGNFDWLVNNIKIFRPGVENARFSWILWDTDHGSGLPYQSYGNVNWKTLTWSLSADKPRADEASTLIFRKLAENEKTRIKFINRFADLLNTVYKTENINNIIDSVQQMLSNDMNFHIAKWCSNTDYWSTAVSNMKLYHKARPDYVIQDIQDCFSIDTFHYITLNSSNIEEGNVKINSIQPLLSDTGWTGIYFHNIPVSIEAVARPGFKFEGWKNLSAETGCKLDLIPVSDTVLEAIFAPVGIDSNRVAINEICYSLPENNSADWIELINKSGVDLTLNGWKITTVTDTFDLNNISIKNDGYYIISNSVESKIKSAPPQGQIAFSGFYINNSCQNLQLINSENFVADNVTYNETGTWNELANGMGFTLELINGYLDNNNASNWRASNCLGGTPGIKNSVKIFDYEGLKINELMGSNSADIIKDEYGEADDWIELYNSGKKSIDLRGLLITDDDENAVKYQVPVDSDPIWINPGEFVLLWADGQEQGPLHLNFNINKQGDYIGLYKNNGHSLEKIDDVKFSQTAGIISYGREYDGIDSWLYLCPTPGSSNKDPFILTVKVPGNSDLNSLLVNVFPNPAKEFIIIKEIQKTDYSGNIIVEIYDLMGHKQLIENRKFADGIIKIDIENITTGIYVIKITGKSGNSTSKLISIIK